MIRKLLLFVLPAFLFICPVSAQTRALLVSCSSFLSCPELGNKTSGNLQLIAYTLQSCDDPVSVTVLDGTAGSLGTLLEQTASIFSGASEEDLSIVYICTHGVRENGETRLVLSDGITEELIGSRELFDLLHGIGGQKLLIIDSCYSGALVGHQCGMENTTNSVFSEDPTIHVLTSSAGDEATWYVDSSGLISGAISYFAYSLSCGLGMYDRVEADLSGDGLLTLQELYLYLWNHVPSSSCQIFSAGADELLLPSSGSSFFSKPLSDIAVTPDFLYGSKNSVTIRYTSHLESVIRYRIVPCSASGWDWSSALTLTDAGDTENGYVSIGRKKRTISFSDTLLNNTQCFLFQIYSDSQGILTLCDEKLIAVQNDGIFTLSAVCAQNWDFGDGELEFQLKANSLCSIAAVIRDQDGNPVKHLAAELLLHPAKAAYTFYWNGLDDLNQPVPDGNYTLSVDTAFQDSPFHTETAFTVCNSSKSVKNTEDSL